MKALPLLISLLSLLSCPLFLTPKTALASTSQSGPVLPGVDVLQQRNFDLLRGQRVGLVTNQTGRNRDGTATIDLLHRAPGVQLVTLFSPEHGIRGQAIAGASVRNSRDSITGLPIYSLYGTTRQPTRAMLRGIQTLVFDMQSVGSRSYTFLATLEKCRQACAANKIRFVVLDRPNPLGRATEGNIPRQFSFVCPFPIPYRHGLTLGEMARYLNARARTKCSLTVVPLQNYQVQPFEQTGLQWTPSSPNIPRATSAYYYSATGLLGELPALSIGIGTPWPFEVAGAPGLNAYALAARLNARKIPGWKFHPAAWTPTKGRHARRQCQGVYIQLLDPNTAQVTRLNFEIYDAVRRTAPSLKFFSNSGRNAMFDAVCGTREIRTLMQRGQSPTAIWNVWNQGASNFAKQTAKYRLY